MQIGGSNPKVPTHNTAHAQNQAGVQLLKQALAQDATVLQVVSAATQPSGAPAPIMPTTTGLGMNVNLLI